MTPWEVLGLSPGADRKTIRRAYADRLRGMEPEADPDAFQALCDARDAALAAADGSPLPGGHADTIAPDRPADAEPVAAEDAPPPPIEIDLTELHRLRDMVTGASPGADAAAIEEQGRRVLRDPALLNVDHAEAIETFLAELIYHGTPATDPLLGGMIAFFGWDADENAATRTPLINWILQRDVDRIFELELRHQNRRWARLLDDLRTVSAYEWEARRRRPSPYAVEFLLRYLHDHHPTTVTGLPNESIRWWQDRIERTHARVGPLAWIANWRRNGTFMKGARDFGLSYEQESSFQMPVPVIVCLIFGFFAIQRACNDRRVPLDQPFTAATEATEEDTLGNASSFINEKAGSAPAYRPVATPSPGYTTFDADLSDLLDYVTSGHLTDAATVKQRNPALYMLFKDDWERARAADRPLAKWREQASRRVTTAFQRALAGGDEAFIIDNARFTASRLRWAARASMAECVALIDGRPVLEPYDFSTYRGSLYARAVTMPLTDASGGGGGRFTIPAAIVDDAAKRSGFGEAAFRAAMDGRGGAHQRCNAEIALLDAATLHGEQGVAMLRKMFGPPRQRR